MNIINYLQSLYTQKNETNNESYKKLINDEIEFYNKKLNDYSHLYVNIC